MPKRERDLNLLRRRIKKAGKKVKRLKAWTAQTREEMTELTNSVEKRYQAIVQIREAIHPLTFAAEALDAQVVELISAWLADNDDD